MRIHVVFEIDLRGEIVQRIVAFARLHPARNVIVNAEKIDARSGNQLHVGFCHLRQAVVCGQNFAQRFRELMLHQRIEEAAVEEQIRIPRRFLIFRAVVAGIGRRQIQHYANLAFQRQRAKLAHRFGVGQHNVKRHLRRQPAVFLAGIVEVVQIAALNRYNRLVEGDPVFHFVTKQLEGSAGKTREEIRHVRRLKAAVLLLQRFRHIKVIEVNHRLNAVFDHLIKVGMIETHRVRIGRAGFEIVNQPRPLNRGAKGVESGPLHQRHVLRILMIGIANGLRPNLLIKTFRLFGKPAVPNRTVRLVADAFRLRTGCRRAPKKAFRKLIPGHNASCKLKKAAPDGRSQ